MDLTSTSSDRAYTPGEDDHSSLVGGSSATRRIECPASWSMENKLPAALSKESSSYADEGTALHEAIAHILDNNIEDLSIVEGMVFKDYVMTPELIDEALIPALEVFDMIDAESEGGLEFMLEARCEMPGIDGAFGTSDVIARDDVRSAIVDWKFGAGVPVLASKTVDDVVVPNAQLMFYARAAMHKFPDMFQVDNPDWPVDLYIVQPRIRDGLGEKFSHVRVTVRELEAFRWTLIRAVSEARGPNPSMKRGDHCRFAQCKTICPLHHKAVLDLSKLSAAEVTSQEKTEDLSDAEYGELLAMIMDLGEIVEAVVSEAAKQAHVFLDDGGVVPGYGLYDKRAGGREWVDEKKADAWLGRKGLDVNGRREVKTISPAKAEKLLKAAGNPITEKEADRYIVAGTSSGKKVARDSKLLKPAQSRAALTQELASKLALLTKA